MKSRHFSPPPPCLPDPPDTSNINWSEMKGNPKIDKYLERIRRLEQQQADEMARKIAEDKHQKRRDFLFQLVQALIIAAVTLLIEHCVDIFHALQSVFAH